MTAVVIGGTPCPDPQSFQIIRGGMQYDPNFGTPMGCLSDRLEPKGGCISPGHNSVECESRDVEVNLNKYRTLMIVDTLFCPADGTTTDWGKIAYNSSKPCDYCRTPSGQ